MQDKKTRAGTIATSRVLSPRSASEYALLVRYLGRKHLDIRKLDEAIAQRDGSTIRRIGHNLSGSGVSYGLPRISELGRAIEAAAEREAFGEVAGFVRDLEHYVTRIEVTSVD